MHVRFSTPCSRTPLMKYDNYVKHFDIHVNNEMKLDVTQI